MPLSRAATKTVRPSDPHATSRVLPTARIDIDEDVCLSTTGGEIPYDRLYVYDTVPARMCLVSLRRELNKRGMA